MNVLELRDIHKEFPGVVAVDHVNLELKKGEVLALAGENGAGKSTLIKILAGAYQADQGEIMISGEVHKSYNTKEAIDLGVGVVYQELNYLNDLSIAENIYLGRVPTRGTFNQVDYKELYSKAQQAMERVGLGHRNPAQPISELSIAEKQLVEIARAFTRDVRILVMDEPTSALNDAETHNLFALIKQIKQTGVSIIYISHRMNELFELSDRIQIMRDGRSVAILDTNETTTEEIVQYMVGREITDMYPSRNPEIGDVVFSLQNLSTDFLKDVSLEVREGEVVGLFGLMGSGRTEIANCIMGTRKYIGNMQMNGQAYESSSPLDALRRGIAYVPAERKSDGVNLIASVKDNITIANLNGFTTKYKMNLKREAEIAKEWVKKLDIRTPGIAKAVEDLSGGNQQKVVLAKGLNTEPRFMILNEPTRGIDVGAKVEIYNLINELCYNKKAVLMISSELPEIMSMSDRIYVICEGKLRAEIERPEFSQETILKYAIGE